MTVEVCSIDAPVDYTVDFVIGYLAADHTRVLY